MGHSKKQDEKYDAKMAYNKNLSAKARMHYLENNIADHKGPSAYGKMHKGPDMYGKKHDGPSAYGKMHKGPSKMDPMYNGKPGVQKEDFQQFAGPSKHGKMHDSPMSMGGSFMSKHSSNSYFHKQNLLDDMPIDDHAGSPAMQKNYSLDYTYTDDDQKNVMDKRTQNFSHHLDLANEFAGKIQELNKTDHGLSEDQINQINKKAKDLGKNVDIRYQRFNKSKDSIGKVNTSKANDVFNNLMK
tara:strand:+ start:49 stop:774 length:726 start_codon:yes stop_codon:yes gene_type:complete